MKHRWIVAMAISNVVLFAANARVGISQVPEDGCCHVNSEGEGRCCEAVECTCAPSDDHCTSSSQCIMTQD